LKENYLNRSHHLTPSLTLPQSLSHCTDKFAKILFESEPIDLFDQFVLTCRSRYRRGERGFETFDESGVTLERGIELRGWFY
jgi:hypothetical protein